MTGRSSSVAVVTIAAGRREHLRLQARSLTKQVGAPNLVPLDGGVDAQAITYVVVDMGGPDPRLVVPDILDPVVVDLPARGPLPLAAARNAGWAAAEADITIFLDVDCIAHPTLVSSYRRLVDDRVGVHAGPVGYLGPEAPRCIDTHRLARYARYQPGRPTPTTELHRANRPELFWSLSFAVDRRSWCRIGGFDEEYVGYGGEDTDFSRRAGVHGIDIWFSGSARAFHQYHPVSNPPVEHVRAICINATRFRRIWGAWPMTGWLAEFAALGLIDWEPDGERCTPTAAASAAEQPAGGSRDSRRGTTPSPLSNNKRSSDGSEEVEG